MDSNIKRERTWAPPSGGPLLLDPMGNPALLGEPPLYDVSHIRKKYLDIAYGSVSPAQRIDLYLPEKGTGPYPVIVYIHGGGFAIGDKRGGAHLMTHLDCLNRGYALASVGYRLSGEALFPAAVSDCRDAVRFLRKKASKYNLDPDRFGTIGESAGGNLSAMLAMNSDSKVLDKMCGEELSGIACTVQASVDWFGPTDFSVMDQQGRDNGVSFPNHNEPDSPESCYLGGTLRELDSDYVQLANPMTYISSRMCSLFIEHGNADTLVPCQQSEILYKAIIDRIGPDRAQLWILDGANHDDPMYDTQENMALVWAFFDEHLKP